MAGGCLNNMIKETILFLHKIQTNITLGQENIDHKINLSDLLLIISMVLIDLLIKVKVTCIMVNLDLKFIKMLAHTIHLLLFLIRKNAKEFGKVHHI